MTTSDPPDDPRIGRRRALRAGVGALAVGVGAASFAGTATAHFPTELDIDVVPGSERNPVFSTDRGFVPVLVHTTTFEDDGEPLTFDPTERAVRYRFGASAVVMDDGGARPVDDGHAFRGNLLLCFPTAETGIDEDTTDVRLEWERTEAGGHGWSGTDRISVIDHGWPIHGDR